MAQPAAALALQTRLSYLAVRPSSCFNRPGPCFIRLSRLRLLQVHPGRSQPLAVSPCGLASFALRRRGFALRTRLAALHPSFSELRRCHGCSWLRTWREPEKMVQLRGETRGLAQRGRKNAGGPLNGSYLDKRRLIPRSREYGCKEAKREARPCRKVLKRLHKTQEALLVFSSDFAGSAAGPFSGDMHRVGVAAPRRRADPV